MKLFNAHFVSILHVCGGDPMTVFERIKELAYSPRMWR